MTFLVILYLDLQQKFMVSLFSFLSHTIRKMQEAIIKKMVMFRRDNVLLRLFITGTQPIIRSYNSVSLVHKTKAHTTVSQFMPYDKAIQMNSYYNTTILGITYCTASDKPVVGLLGYRGRAM